MKFHHPLFLLLLLLILLLCFSPTFSLLRNDTESLLRFRSDTDPHGTLLSNWSTLDPCTGNWVGVLCFQNRVSSLSLPSFNLRGPVSSLSTLDQLRHLDLHDNRLNGSLSPLSNCSNLKHIYLSRNDFSGQIPPEFDHLRRLLRLDLSDNNLDGPIPNGLSNLTRLLTLRLQDNALSGRVPDFSGTLTKLRELNLSNNELVGSLPNWLVKKFGVNSFLGNEGLCGLSPLQRCTLNGDLDGRASGAATAQTVPSNPTTLFPTDGKRRPRKGLSHGVIVALIVTNCLLIIVVASFIMAFCCRGSRPESDYGEEREMGKRRSSYGSEKRVYASNVSSGGGESDGTAESRLVFFDRRNKQFELEDLLRASAEMLGKGSIGTVYRAVLDDGGTTVAVKRLKDANPCARKEFEQYMDVIGRLKHPNIVRLRAYYYAREEKLLVYDYLPNGNLHNLLHGNRGPGRIPLDWTTRISIALGAARGLARIHSEYSSSKIPHGNIKSSNVLLDKNGVACISDFGLSLLLNPAHAVARLGGYKAPEQTETKRLSQQADVYGFGVLLLELLTGKSPSQFPNPNPTQSEDRPVDLPKWVGSVVRDEWTAEVFDPELLRYKNIEEELVAMLHVAMACVCPQPEKRPTMAEVAKMIEDIRVEESPIGEDYDESRDSLSPSVPTTEDAVVGY